MEKKEGVKRVLITSIGGGNTETVEGKMELKKYHNTVYSINNKKYKATTYMPKVVEEEFGVDKTIIIGTTGTMWDNVYKEYCKKNDEKIDRNYVKNLREIERESDKNTPIEALNIDKFNEEFGNGVKGIVIKYGLNREEIFKNFNSIIQLEEEFNDEDEYEVILDITHSFRSTAFWMFLVMTYLTDVSNKNIKIIEVTYGMHEITRKNDDSSPIILLNSFLEILNWIKGASELKQYGNSYYILNELKDSNDDIPEDIKKELRNFSNAMNMNYIATLMESIDRLKNLKEQINEISGPAKHIVPEVLMNFIEDFDLKEKDDIKKAYLLQATLAKWHCDQKRYAMAAINISEAIVTFILVTLEINSKKLKGKFDPDNKGQKWLREIHEKYKNDLNLSDDEKQIYEYAEMYVETVRIRKEAAHSLGKQLNIDDDVEKLEKYSNNVIRLLKNQNIIKEFEKKLGILKGIDLKDKPEKISVKSEKNTNEDRNKVLDCENINSKKILVVSTRLLSDEEKNELEIKYQFQKENIIELEANDIEKWKKANSDRELKYFKDKIISDLKEGDCILLHGDYLKMNKMRGYAINTTNPLKPYKIKILIFSDRVSPKDEYFKEI